MSAVNADRIFLSAQSDAVDGHLQGERSPFLGRKPFQAQNFIFGWGDISAEPAGGYGSTAVFNIVQDCDYIGKIEVVVDHGALSSTGAGSLYPRYVDWLGFAEIDEIVIRWNANRLQSIKGEDLFVLHALRYRTDDSQEELLGGGLQALPATRKANAARSSYKTYTPIDLATFFGGAPHDFLPYNIEVFRDKLRLEMKMKPLKSVAESDGSDLTGSVNSIKLRIQKVHVTDVEQAQILGYLKSTTPELNIAAAARICTVQEHQDDLTVANSTNQQTFNLSATRPTKETIFYVRKDSDLPDGSTIKSSIQHFNFQEIAEIELTGISRTIVGPVEGDWIKYRHNNQFHSGDPSHNIYAISHSLAPEADNDQWGYINYGTVSQPQIKIKMPSGWATTGKMNTIYQTLNAYVLAEGDLRILNA